MWNWVPSIDRVIKIPPSMMSQSWMGSDFTNDDLIKESSLVNDYAHAIIGIDTIDSRACWRILLSPLPGAPVVWGKIIAWITVKNDIETKAEYFDDDSALVNTERLTEIPSWAAGKFPRGWKWLPRPSPAIKPF